MPGFVRKLDLTGNKRADYIVDHGELKCSTFASVLLWHRRLPAQYLCRHQSWRIAAVFSGIVRRYRVSKGAGAKTITFHLHGGFCAEGGYYDCVKKRRITEAPFEFKDRVVPSAPHFLSSSVEGNRIKNSVP